MGKASRQQHHNNTNVTKPVEALGASAGFFIGDSDGGRVSPGLPHSSDCGCQSHLPGIPCSSSVIPLGHGYLNSGGTLPDDRGKDGGESVTSPSLAVASPVRPVRGTVAGGVAQAAGAGSSTSLDLIETSEQVGEPKRVGWGALRRECLRMVAALRGASEEGRAVRMESCSREWMAYRHLPTRSVVLRSNRCRDRFCLVCMALRSQEMVRRFEALVEGWPVVRMMTFTVRSQAVLADQIGFLRGCFRDLRRRRAWKRYVKGYLVTMEITRGAAGWHAHLHVLADGSYWPFEDLRCEWKKVTKGEGSVDIRRAGSVKEALKYVVKPKCLAGMDGAAMDELIETMKGVRTLSTGGTLRGVITEEELDSDDEMGLREEYEPIGRLDGIVERYRAGDRSRDVVDTVRLALKLGILERVDVRLGGGSSGYENRERAGNRSA